MSYPNRPLTPNEEYLVKGSSRWQCFVCSSTQLRPLVLLAREGFPPGDNRHYITYSHDAIFGCDVCHSGYAEIRRNDSFDWEELSDQDEHCVLDHASVESLAAGLKECPAPVSEACTCPVHASLRKSWAALPRSVWSRYTADFPPALLRLAEPDPPRSVLSGIWVEVEHGLPRLAVKDGNGTISDAEDLPSN